MYHELLPVQRDALLDTFKRLQDEEAEMAHELKTLQEQTASEAATIAKLEKECEVYR